MDVVLNRLSPRRQAILRVFSSAVGIVICVCLVWFGFEVAWDHFQRGVYDPTILEFPKALVIVIIPIGSLILLLQFVRRGYRSMMSVLGRVS